MTDIAAIILAAGKGTRMKSNRAKVNFPIAGKTMLQRVVQTAQKAGCGKICVVVGYQMDQVMTSLIRSPKSECGEPEFSTPIVRSLKSEEGNRSGAGLSFVEQREQLGTGHAVQMAKQDFIDYQGDIFILCGDVPLLKAETLVNMYRRHGATGALATVLTAYLDDAGKYGRIIRDAGGMICGITEYKDATPEQRLIREFNTGIYCFNAFALFEALANIGNDNEQREYYLTDVIRILHDRESVVESVVLDDLMEASGVNSQEQLAELEDALYDSIRKHWLNNGVVIHNPASVVIGEDVMIGTDVEIGANCILEGRCQIGQNTFIGHNCLIHNAVIGTDCILDGNSIVSNCNIPPGSHLHYRNDVISEANEGNRYER